MSLEPPVATDPVELLADWLELQALADPDGLASIASLVSAIRTTGSTDVFKTEDDEEPADHGSDLSQQIAADAFSEAEARSQACAGEYPFEIEEGSIRVKPEKRGSPYTFMLMLSRTEPTPGHEGTAVLFENVCTHAARQYLGGTEKNAEAFRFGAPRKSPISQFGKALDRLCEELLEGGGCLPTQGVAHKGDRGLDIVAWKNFPDKKPGKFIAFGQCAAGAVNWAEKLNELDGSKFCKKFFKEVLLVDPVRMFFVPRRVSPRKWREVGIDAGIVFDRCRIAAHLPGLSADFQTKCESAALALVDHI